MHIPSGLINAVVPTLNYSSLLVTEVNTAFCWLISDKVRAVGCNMMSGPTIHQPMQLCHNAQGNTNVIDLLNGGSGFYNMTIYGLGTASTLFILLFSIHLILFSLLAIGLNVPFLIAVMASKIGVLLLFTGRSFAIAFPPDWGDCIEGGGSAISATFFILNMGDYAAGVKISGVTKGKDCGGEHS